MEFSGFYIKFLKLAWGRINQIYPESRNWTERLKRDFGCELGKRLEPVALRSLITEIHYCKQNGLLQGSDTKEEYSYFNENYFKVDSNCTEFFEAYPLLKEILLEIMENYCQYIAEMMSRLQRDRQQINDMIFMKDNIFETVISFKQLGDLHLGGKCVSCLILDNDKKIIYKPREIKYTGIYYDYLERFYTGQNLKNRRILIVNRKKYGWMEYIAPKPCYSEEEIKIYYRRLGINLCLCYLTNNRDMHFENIIAHGSYPILVDLEVFDCERKDVKRYTAEEKVRYLLRTSVLNIGILPFYIENRMGRGINLSGIEAGRQKIPYKLPVIVNSKTSDIKVEYKNPVLQNAQNIPILKNKPVLAGDYIEELIKGFNGAYVQAMEEKDALIKRLMNDLKGIRCRFLIKNTQQYKMLQNLSYWPELMSDIEKRYRYLQKAYGKEEVYDPEKRIRYYEIWSILKGDMPYFWFTSDDRCLYLGEDEKVEGFLGNTLLWQIKEKLDSLSEKDRKCQVQFIRQMMALAKTSDLENKYCLPSLLEQKLKTNSKEILLGAVMRLADEILQNAIYGENGDVCWSIPRLHMSNETEWNLESANMYMYSGISGICVFFHALCRISEHEQYKKIRNALDRTMINYTELVCKNREYLQSGFTGALNGEGSVVYAYQLIYQLTKDDKYLELAKKHMVILDELTEKCRCPDLIAGNAGAVLIYLNMFEITNDDSYLTKAMLTADQLAEVAVHQKIGGVAWDIEGVSVALTGFSHGNAGIAYAYIKLFEICKQERYRTVIKAAIEYENLLYIEEIANWADLRKESSDESNVDSVSWCHGAAGILLSRLEGWKGNIGGLAEVLEEDVKRAAKKVIQTHLRRGLCLCHGNLGNLDIIFQYLKYIKDFEIEEKAESCLAELAEGICCNRIKYIPQEENPGFMNGFSGMGYVFLRKLENLPDILAIEI